MGTYKGKVGGCGITLRNKITAIGIKLPKDEYPVKIHFELKSGGAYWKNSSYKTSSGTFYLYGDKDGKKAVKFGSLTLNKISSNVTNKDFNVDGKSLMGCSLYFNSVTSDSSGVGLRNVCQITVTTKKGKTEPEKPSEPEKEPAPTTIDISNINYSVIVMLTTGKEIYLDKVATNIAWEENESELATRLNLTVRDVEITEEMGATKKVKRLAQALALCTAVYVFADYGKGKKEVFRGTIWEWGHSQVHDDEIVITAYDPLFYLQKSEDYALYSAGKSTKDICKEILSNWGVPLGKFNAPSITHEKLALKTKKISAILTEVLDKAKLKLGAGYVIRSTKGKCEILGMGQNETIWTFGADTNLMSVQDKYSMTNLITKVVILGKEDKDGAKRPPVEATEYGDKKYGTIQKIMTLGSKELADAKEEAKQVIKEKGKPERKMQLISPDFPEIRKGDRIRVLTDNVKGYFFVLSVSHNATTQQMQMEVEPQ